MQEVSDQFQTRNQELDGFLNQYTFAYESNTEVPLTASLAVENLSPTAKSEVEYSLCAESRSQDPLVKYIMGVNLGSINVLKANAAPDKQDGFQSQ